jgi:hypothetical protein
VIADTGAIAQGEWIEWDVTSLIAADGTYTFQLANTSNDGVGFRSREFSNVPLRPELVVDVTNDAYPRPRAASPVRVPLVPAFAACTAPNRVHGPPLANPSCAPPAPRSSALTVGTPDVNGQGASSTGFVQLKALPGSPGNPSDDADVAVTVQLSDVRESSGLGLDYTGELQLRAALRLSDRAAGTATVEDFPLTVSVPCTITVSLSTGGNCAVATTGDAVAPGMVDEGSRAVWELGAIEVLDGGPDGDADTPGNAVFATSGVFVP